MTLYEIKSLLQHADALLAGAEEGLAAMGMVEAKGAVDRARTRIDTAIMEVERKRGLVD